MCGIAGWYRRGHRPVDRAVISEQCDRIIHRGPDDFGDLVDGDFGFGMRRLSIIDLAHGHQPMVSPDGRHAIIFNGEIYNHLDLRPELEAAGHRFATRSDTETILAAVVAWGDAAWSRLEGMFAAAVWDRRTRTLTLARDPLGIKPLYIADQGGGLAFASELKALLPVPGLRFDVDDRAVHDFFCFGHVRGPRTIYRDVRMLPPGHTLTLGPDGAAVERCFWRFRPVTGSATMDEAGWVDAFREEWLATVRRHMLADVPLGSFLSGGVDSSAVTAAMARLSNRPVTAFTIGFPSRRFDETPHAATVARHLGCDHHVAQVDLRAAAEILPRIQACYDEPFADPAAVPTWYLARMAAGHVKVVLAGDGGDEVFAGYRRHRNEARMTGLARLPWPILRIAGLSAHLPPLPNARWNRMRQRVRRFWDTSRLPTGYDRFFEKTQITTAELRADLLCGRFRDRFEGDDRYRRLREEFFPDPLAGDALEQFLHADLTLNLPSAMLTKVDRASMAHSLEVRVPFLSHRLVDWAAGLPRSMKLRGGVGKYVVRRAVEPWLPAGILDRGKQGFQMPLADWFAGGLGTYAREVWNDSGAASSGYLDPAAVERVLAAHAAGRADHSRFLYSLTLFSLWWAARP